jgi:segregation and condensation protein A
MEDYRVLLPEFHGPLDLLLHLVKRNEVDVLDIPMARIAEQFRTYVHVLQVIDVEWAGEFLVTLAMLMEIKSRMLLPRPEEITPETFEDDPRTELVTQLLEHKRLRDAAARLEGRAHQHERHLARDLVEPDASASGPPQVRAVELWDLLSAFGRIISEAEEHSAEVVLDETPQEVYRANVLKQVREAGRVAFRDLFTPPFVRIRLVGVFLALLELIKTGDVGLEAGEAPEDIWIVALAKPG